MVDLGGFYSVRVRVLHNSDTENVRDLSTSISRADGSGGTAYRNPHLNPNPTLTLEPSIPIHITSTLPGHNLGDRPLASRGGRHSKNTPPIPTQLDTKCGKLRFEPEIDR